jgi:hypothetical protein
LYIVKIEVTLTTLQEILDILAKIHAISQYKSKWVEFLTGTLV